MDYIFIIITIYIIILTVLLMWILHTWPKRLILGTTALALLVPLWLGKLYIPGGGSTTQIKQPSNNTPLFHGGIQNKSTSEIELNTDGDNLGFEIL